MNEYILNGKSLDFPEIQYGGEANNNRYWAVSVEMLVDDKSIEIEKSFIDTPDPDWDAKHGYTAMIHVRTGMVGGKVRDTTPTVIKVGKNTGKKNFTNVLTQAIKDANSMYNKQLKKSNATYPLPMRAMKRMPLGDTKGKQAQVNFDGETEYIVQRKFDGIRCIVTRDEQGKMFAYSRRGIVLTGYENIIEEVRQLIAIIDGPVSIDGEMYKHGTHLNKISGQARKGDIEGLEFNVFDVFFPQSIDDLGMAQRQEKLVEMFEAARDAAPGAAAEHEFTYLKEVMNHTVRTEDEFAAIYKQFLDEGYEGAMIRRPTGAYKYSTSDRQSPDLIKVKPIDDAEFTVVDFLEGKKGKDVGAIIWVCEANNEDKTTFHVVPKNMTYPERKALFVEASKTIKVKNVIMTKFEAYMKGKMMTVEYPGLSKNGVPAQAKALHFRVQDTNEPDPIAQVLEA